MMKLSPYSFFIILIFIISCNKKVETPPDLGYDYAPAIIGKYVVYDVDSTVYNESMDTIYYKYRIKEKLEEIYVDNESRKAIKLVRYIKKYDPLLSYDQTVWQIKDVWNYTKTPTTLEVVEEDVRFTKLSFPIKENASWNGNANNSKGEWNYTYKYIDQAEKINGTMFENVLYVEQKDDKNENRIHRQYYIEKYAKNIGIVYKEIKDLYSKTVKLYPNGLPIPVEERITYGVIYKLTYVTDGIE